MSKKEGNKDQENLLVDVGSAYNRVEYFIENNKKILLVVAASVIVVVAGFFWFQKSYLPEQEKEAATSMFKAEVYFKQDSLKQAINGDGLDSYGFVDIIEDYPYTKSASLAKYYLGICYLKTKSYQEAIDILKDFDSKDIMLSALSVGMIGDAYSELGEYETAISYYLQAADINANSITSPSFLLKAGILLEQEFKDFKQANLLYQRIKDEFSESTEARDIDKYIARSSLKI